MDQRGRPVLVLGGHPSHPRIGWLVDVRVAVEDRVVDRGVVVEEVARVLHTRQGATSSGDLQLATRSRLRASARGSTGDILDASSVHSAPSANVLAVSQ